MMTNYKKVQSLLILVVFLPLIGWPSSNLMAGEAPGPILLVHGLNSSAETWVESVVFELQDQGYAFGGTYRSNLSAASTLGDVEVAPEGSINSDGDIWLLNFDVEGTTSNLEAIYKQSEAIRQSIGYILENRDEKITLVGHSMGGLAIAGYMVGDLDSDGVGDFFEVGSVGKVITLGTPFGGAPLGNLGDFFGSIGSWELMEDTPAIRDLSQNSEHHKNIFLFGGTESEVGSFPHDVNCNGTIDDPDPIKGITEYLPSEWPQDVEYFWIVGNISALFGDGIVFAVDQVLGFGERREISAYHAFIGCTEVEATEAIIEALDEPDSINLAAKVIPGENYLGHISLPGEGNGTLDTDIYKVFVDTPSQFDFFVSNLPEQSTLTILDSDGLSVLGEASGASTLHVSQDILTSGHDLYVKIQSEAVGSDWGDPCDSETNNLQSPYQLQIHTDGSVYISGQITTNNYTPISGIAVTGPLGQTETNANGEYTIEAAFGDSFEITPFHPNYTFEPATLPFETVTSNESGADFQGIYEAPELVVTVTVQNPEPVDPGGLFRIHGEVRYLDGTPLDGGLVKLLDGECPGAQATFSGYQFTTPLCEAPDTSGYVRFEVNDLSAGGSLEVSFFLIVIGDDEVYPRVLVPDQNSVWCGGGTSFVSWEFTDPSVQFPLEFYFSDDDGSSWQLIGSYQGSDRTDAVQVPDVATDMARIKIQDENDPAVYDISDRFSVRECLSLPYGAQLAGAVGDELIDNELNFSPDGRYFAYRTSGGNYPVAIYDTRTLQLVRTIGSCQAAVAFSPNSNYLAWVYADELYVWDLLNDTWETNGREIGAPEGEGIVWLGDSTIALIGDDDGDELAIHVFSRSGSQITVLEGNVPFEFRSLTADDNYIYASGFPDNNSDRPFEGDGTYIYRWTIGTWSRYNKAICINKGFSVKASPTGSGIMLGGDRDSGCDSGSINARLFSQPGLTELDEATWWFENGDIRSVAWSPDGAKMVAVDNDGHAALYGTDLNMYQELESYGSYIDSFADAHWSSNGIIAVLGNATSSGIIRFYAPDDETVPVITLDENIRRGTANFSGQASDNTTVVSLTGSVDDGSIFEIPMNYDGTFFYSVEALNEGAHQLRLLAEDMAGNTGTLTATIQVDCAVPEPVVTQDPSQGTECLVGFVQLEWTTIPEFDQYDFFVGTTCETGDVFSVTGSSFGFDSLEYNPGDTINWKVRARTVCETVGPWSTCRSFTIGSVEPLVTPVLYDDIAAINNEGVVTLSWDPVPDALGYEIQIGNDCGIGETLEVTESFYDFEVNPYTSTQWRVRAFDPCRYSLWSDCLSFFTTVGMELPTLQAVTGQRSIKILLDTSLLARSGQWELLRKEMVGDWFVVAAFDSEDSVWEDTTARPGVEYRYKVQASGNSAGMESLEIMAMIPKVAGVAITFFGPNPFNPQIKFEYELPAGVAQARISIHDLAGRRVQEIQVADRQSGFYSFVWDGRGFNGNRLASGIYYVAIKTDQGRDIQKITMVK